MGLQCAVKLGIPTAIHNLGGAASLPDLVSALSLPPAKLPFLRRLMRLLATSAVFATDDTTEAGTYRLTPLSCLLVEGVEVDSHPRQNSVVLASTSRYFVEEGLRAAAAAVPVRGGARRQALPREHDVVFNDGLAAHDDLGFATVLRECRDVFQGLQSLTDCSGGDGTAARAIVKAFPHIKCTVLDLPKAIEKALADGIVNYVAGDMFINSIPAAQAVLLKFHRS